MTDYEENEARILSLCEAQQASDRKWGTIIWMWSVLGFIFAAVTGLFLAQLSLLAIPSGAIMAMFLLFAFQAKDQHQDCKEMRDEVLERALEYRKSLEKERRGF